jgi:hypothetical protein
MVLPVCQAHSFCPVLWCAGNAAVLKGDYDEAVTLWSLARSHIASGAWGQQPDPFTDPQRKLQLMHKLECNTALACMHLGGHYNVSPGW